MTINPLLNVLLPIIAFCWPFSYWCLMMSIVCYPCYDLATLANSTNMSTMAKQFWLVWQLKPTWSSIVMTKLAMQANLNNLTYPQAFSQLSNLVVPTALFALPLNIMAQCNILVKSIHVCVGQCVKNYIQGLSKLQERNIFVIPILIFALSDWSNW